MSKSNKKRITHTGHIKVLMIVFGNLFFLGACCVKTSTKSSNVIIMMKVSDEKVTH